jgi:SAM-dependent methyltransferase
MSISTPIPAEAASEEAGALIEQVFASSTATMELACMYLGDRLGLYRALADGGPATPAELARRTSSDTRYVREWLEQQAAAGVLSCEDPAAAPDARRFALPAAHAEALLDPESLASVTGLTQLTMGVLTALPRLTEAFRTGEGIPYADFGDDTREGIAAGNRPMFAHQLGSEWLPAVPAIHDRLNAAPAARVADIACGCGWSSIALARAYPLARVDGLDEDAASIARARENVAAAGLGDRVRAFRHDASDDSLTGSYDVVTIFEALHDMARPVEALRTARGLLVEGGSVFVADERAAEEFAAPADPMDRMFYGFSVLHCLPVGRVGERSEATGTVIRPHTVREYAERAGFGRVEVLDIEHDVWRFYRLVP